MGEGRITFRIEGASRPNSESNYLSWHARGEAAPLLRIAYVQPEPEPLTQPQADGP